MAYKAITTVYINPNVKDEAKKYGINISRAAQKGIEAEIKRAKQMEALEQNEEN